MTKQKKPDALIVYLSQPLRRSAGGYEVLPYKEIAIIKGNTLLATKQLGSNVITLSDFGGDDYAFHIVKKFL